ncbi:MAG: cytochrome d ubiquinol oxidase subunit II [Candidatus Eremiobacteraeota bacterium]|nr:cytochrome d ubiquinol oxidase subunit II [Candidatus Eremiobacteraeota bacterium]
MSLAVGLFAIALCAQLAAVYLTIETRTALRDDFRRRAYWATFVVAITGLLALAAGVADAPALISHLRAPLPIAIIAAAMLLGILVLLLLRFDNALTARVAVAAEVTAVLCAWYAAQAPYVLTQLGVVQPAAPHVTLIIFLWTSLIGGIVLLPSLLLLFGVFKRAPID